MKPDMQPCLECQEPAWGVCYKNDCGQTVHRACLEDHVRRVHPVPEVAVLNPCDTCGEECRGKCPKKGCGMRVHTNRLCAWGHNQRHHAARKDDQTSTGRLSDPAAVQLPASDQGGSEDDIAAS